MKINDIKQSIISISPNLKWSDIVSYCKTNNYNIKPSKKGYKVYIGKSIWSIHLEHRISNQLKHGIIRELKKILIKENQL